MAVYSESSYFGDNDVLLTKNGFRTTTAVAIQDSQVYSAKMSSLEESLEKYPSIRKIMNQIAEQKTKYYSALKEEIKIRYKAKRDQEKLIKDKRHDEWTEYMSLKRKLIKKQARMQINIREGSAPLTLESVSKKIHDQSEIKSQKKSSKSKQKVLRREVQVKVDKDKYKVANKDGRQIHLDIYTKELKKLIGKLNDSNLDA